MPTTRKRIIKTVYKDENSEEEEGGDFSDSGSEAIISEVSSSDDIGSESSPDEEEYDNDQSFNKLLRKNPPKKSTKPFVRKVTKRKSGTKNDVYSTIFSIRNLSKTDKSLPNILNLSESGSSDEETPRTFTSGSFKSLQLPDQDHENNDEVNIEYKNVWSNIKQVQDDSEEIAKKTFMELEQHKSIIEETKATLQNYSLNVTEQEVDVNDLLALGEESIGTPEVSMVSKKSKLRKRKFDSESESDDWEEVQETKSVPQQGIQLLVEMPDAGRRKSKTVDIEMMMKRKINRVKKEYQVHMHKVHILCWLGHGNYISDVLNDRALLAAALSLVPSKERRRPLKKVGARYVEEIITMYKNCMTQKFDINEDKLKSNSPPLKTLLLDLIKTKIVTSKKYLVFIFVALLRALGLQCRIMFNFVTLPIKPPATELCSLSTKDRKSSSPQENKLTIQEKKSAATEIATTSDKICNKTDVNTNTRKTKLKKKNIAQMDGNYDTSSDEEIREINYNSDHLLYNDYERIMQVDGADDNPTTRRTRSSKRPIANVLESVSKRSRRDPINIGLKPDAICDENKNTDANKRPKRGKKVNRKDANDENDVNSDNIHFREPTNITTGEEKTIPKLPRKSPRRTAQKTHSKMNYDVLLNNKPQKGQIFGASDDFANNGHFLKPLPKNVSSKTVDENIPSLKISRKSQKRHTLKPLAVNVDNEVIEVNRKNGALKDNSRTRCNKLREQAMITSHISEEDVSTPKVHRKSLRHSILKANDDDDAQIGDWDAMKKAQKGRQIIDSKEKNKSPKSTETPHRLTRKRSRIVSKSSHTEEEEEETTKGKRKSKIISEVKEQLSQDKQVVSRNNLTRNNKRAKIEAVENSIINIEDSKSVPATKRTAKGKIKIELDEDIDYSPIEDKHHHSDSDDSFKPKKVSPKIKANRRSNHQGSSLSNETGPSKKNKVDIWCEVFDEELRQWISVDVIEGKVISTEKVYANATHPVCYVVGWDNNNYLKDLTRKYVPHYNTETRKLRVDPTWWGKAVLPYLRPKTKRDKEEDEYLDKIQLEAPIPTVIGEYKNHPLYVLKRHLLKYEALYPPDPTVLGFVRGEPVYARECVYTCRCRKIWYRDHAKVVKLGEKPYKLVKARPRWDKANRKIITDDPPLEIFGPWQVEDFVPPMAENGIVPRNEYGNVELFKECMLPRGTVHLKLPGLHKIAKKLNIDCATAITGFEVLQGFVRPVYDGFVVCKEFEDIITDAWADDQEEQDRKAQEKLELRIYGNWKRIIKGMLIRERLKNKYGFDEPATRVAVKEKSKGPKPVTKRKRK